MLRTLRGVELDGVVHVVGDLAHLSDVTAQQETNRQNDPLVIVINKN